MFVLKNLPKEDAHEKMQELAKSWRKCKRCPLHQGRTNVVIGSGNPYSRALLVAEAPGQHEDESGVPFVGAAGQKLDQFLRAAKLDRETDFFLTNVVGCRPWAMNPQSGYAKNRPPSPEEITECSPRLQETFRIVDPLVVVLLGRTAANALFPFGGVPPRIHSTSLFSVTHPAAFLYGTRDENEEIEHWKTIGKVIRSLNKKAKSGVDWEIALRGQLLTKASVYKKKGS